jgi:hypothetical protein
LKSSFDFKSYHIYEIRETPQHKSLECNHSASSRKIKTNNGEIKNMGWRGNYLFEGGLMWKNDLILSLKLVKKKPNVQT